MGTATRGFSGFDPVEEASPVARSLAGDSRSMLFFQDALSLGLVAVMKPI